MVTFAVDMYVRHPDAPAHAARPFWCATEHQNPPPPVFFKVADPCIGEASVEPPEELKAVPKGILLLRQGAFGAKNRRHPALGEIARRRLVA